VPDVFDQVVGQQQNDSPPPSGDIFDRVSRPPATPAPASLAGSPQDISARALAQTGLPLAAPPAQPKTIRNLTSQDISALNPEPEKPKADSGEGTISARKGVGAALDDLESDIRYGGESTAAGRLLKKLGAPGIYRGTTPTVGEALGGPVIGPVQVARGNVRFYSPESTPLERVKGFNEAVGGALKTVAPALAANPEFLIGLTKYGVAQTAISKAAREMGVNPEVADAIANAVLIYPGAREAVQKMADVQGVMVETPEGKGAGVSAFGGKVKAGVVRTPEGETTVAAKAGGRTFRKTFGGKSAQPELEPQTIQGEPGAVSKGDVFDDVAAQDAHASAKGQHPETVAAAREAADQVPGATVVDPGVKSPESAERKAQTGREPQDLTRAQVVTPDEQSKQQAVQILASQPETQSVEPIKAPNLPIAQVKQESGEPGDANQTREIQVATEAEREAQQATHPLYAKQQEAVAAGNDAEAKRLKGEIDQKHAELTQREAPTSEPIPVASDSSPATKPAPPPSPQPITKGSRVTVDGKPGTIEYASRRSFEKTRVRTESGEKIAIPHRELEKRVRNAEPPQESAVQPELDRDWAESALLRHKDIKQGPERTQLALSRDLRREQVARYLDRVSAFYNDVSSHIPDAPAVQNSKAQLAQARKAMGDLDFRGAFGRADAALSFLHNHLADLLTGEDKKPAPVQGVTSGTAKQSEPQHGAIAVDLDKTLAEHKDGDAEKDPTKIGAPIQSTVDHVKKLLADGKDVWVYTARAADAEAVPAIKAWTKEHIGQELPVTNLKHPNFAQFVDDRAVKPEEVANASQGDHEAVPQAQAAQRTGRADSDQPASGEGDTTVIPAERGARHTGEEAQRSGESAARKSQEETPRLAEVNPQSIARNPARFQYKLGTDAEGVGALLKEQGKYEPDLAGVLTVWRDPEDGKTYVVNGHHRLELALRTNAPTVAVRYINADNAAQARTVGALQNIAQGRGTAIDAAKFMRDSNMTPADLKARGISMGEATARNGVALAGLDDSLFQRVTQGDIPEGRAVAISEATPNHAEQKALLDLVESQERKGKRVTNDVIRELADFVTGSGTRTETTASLFGDQQVEKSLALEKAEVSAYVKQQLAKDRKLFGYVSNEGRASELQRAGNKLDTGKNRAIAESAAQAEAVYDKLKTFAGPINNALQSAAEQLAAGKDANAAKQQAYSAIRKAVSDTLGGRQEPSPGGVPADSKRANPEQPTSKPQTPVEPRTSASLGTRDTPSFARRSKSSESPSETLPGFEGVPAARAQANAEAEGERLTTEAAQAGKSVSATAGKMERESPLFAGSEAGGNRSLFGEDSADGAQHRLTHEQPPPLGEEGGALDVGRILNAWDEIKQGIAAEHAKIQNAKSIEDAIFQLQKQHEARQLENLQLMKAAGGKPEDWEAIYHAQENPAERLTPEQQQLKHDFIDPIHARNQELFAQLRPDATPDEYHIHRVVQGYRSWLDRMLTRKGNGGAGKGNVLSKSADSLKGRTMMALDTPDGRRVVALKGGDAIDVQTGQSYGAIKTADDGSRSAAGNPLVQATTKEIESATKLKYYHNALASEIAENLDLERASAAQAYLEHLKASPEFAEFAIKDNGRTGPPQGYARTDLPQLRGHFFEKHVAEVLDDLHSSLKSGDWSALEKVGDFLTTSLFLNPLVHTPNIAVHAAVNKGKMGVGGFVAPLQAAERKAGMRAIDAVVHQNADYLEALKAGAPLQSHRQDLRDFQKVLFEKMGKELEQDTGLQAKLSKAFGYANPVDLMKAWYRLSGKITWTTNDVAFMQSVYSKMDAGMDLHTAIAETSKHIPDYRIPSRVLDSRLLSKFMRNRLFSRFSAYHYGAAKSYGEAMKSAFGLNEAPNTEPEEPHTGGGGRDGKNWKDIRHGWDILASIGMATFVLYPLIDKALKESTGDSRATMRRAGAATLPYNLQQMVAGKRTPSQVVESVLTPSVIAERGLGLLYGHDPRTGRAVYDPAAPAGKELFQAGRYATGAVYPVDQAFRMMEQSSSQHNPLWQYAGVSFPKRQKPRHEAPMAKDWNYYRSRLAGIGHRLKP
jgi:hypothetical protein